MKLQVKTAFLTVLGLGLLLLAVVACSDSSPPDVPESPAPVTGASQSATLSPVPAGATREDSPAAGGASGSDSTSSASSSASAGSSGDAVPDYDSGSSGSSGAAGSSDSSGGVHDAGASGGQRKPPDNVVYGTVAWPPVVTPPPGSVLEIELLDVSLQDAAAEFIVGQVILDPGEGPVDFYLEFDPNDIKSENTYAVQAALSDPRGNLMYINDTAYDVLTWGQSNYADLELVAAFEIPMPPPDVPGDATAGFPSDGPAGSGGNGGGLAEMPAPIVGVQVDPMGEGYLLTATYLRPPEPGCGELSSYGHEAMGDNIYIDISLMAGEGCGEPAVAEEMEFPIEFPFEPGMSYWVIANGEQTSLFSLPEAGFPPYVTVSSHVESVEWNVMESFPPQYGLWVVTAMPQGSGCSRFNGYDITRAGPYRFEIAITHHIVDFNSAGGAVACTADIAIAKTAIHLGSDFEPGREYTVVVNTETVTITAQ